MNSIHQSSVRKQKELKQQQQQRKKQQEVNRLCQKWMFQSYENYFKDKKTFLKNQCALDQKCANQQCQYERAFNRAQNLLNQYRIRPQQFPIISSTQNINLTKAEQRQYSNYWYRQIGTSNAMGSVQPGYPYSVVPNWPGCNIRGSQTTYTDGFLQNVPG